MAGDDDGEVTVIKGGDLRLVEALAQSDHRRIDEADPEVGVLLLDLASPDQVGLINTLELVGAAVMSSMNARQTASVRRLRTQ